MGQILKVSLVFLCFLKHNNFWYDYSTLLSLTLILSRHIALESCWKFWKIFNLGMLTTFSPYLIYLNMKMQLNKFCIKHLRRKKLLLSLPGPDPNIGGVGQLMADNRLIHCWPNYHQIAQLNQFLPCPIFLRYSLGFSKAKKLEIMKHEKAETSEDMFEWKWLIAQAPYGRHRSLTTD